MQELLKELYKREWNFDFEFHQVSDDCGNRQQVVFELHFILGNQEVFLHTEEECYKILEIVKNW